DAVGNLFGACYRRIAYFASNPPDLNAWHKHLLGTGWTVADITTSIRYLANTFLQDTYAQPDVLYLSSYDGSKYHVELLTEPWDTARAVESAQFLDSSPSVLVGRDPALDAGSAGIDIYGLSHLNGKTVTVFIGG